MNYMVLATSIIVAWLFMGHVLFTMSLVHYDVKDYEIHGSIQVLMYVFWPFLALKYLGAFVGNLLGKVFNWSKPARRR